MVKTISIQEGQEKNNLGKECVKKGDHNLAQDLFNEVIKGLGANSTFISKLLIGEAKFLSGVSLGWKILDLQTAIPNPAHLHATEEEWKPVFSCLYSAFAYQVAVGDKFGRSASIVQILIFRIARGENPKQVCEEMKDDILAIRQERIDAQGANIIKRLTGLEQLIHLIINGADLQELRNITGVIIDL